MSQRIPTLSITSTSSTAAKSIECLKSSAAEYQASGRSRATAMEKLNQTFADESVEDIEGFQNKMHSSFHKTSRSPKSFQM